MPIYETTLILKPSLADPQVVEWLDKAKQSIIGEGGEIFSQEVWGRRKFSHLIGKHREGVYAYLKYRGSSALLRKLSHNFSISDDVLRDISMVARDRKLREKKSKGKSKAPAASV